jgi:hypothetical protein
VTNSKIKLAASILAGLSGLFALSALSDVVPAEYHKWVALAVAVTAYIAQWLESRIPARSSDGKPPTSPAVALLALALLGAPACGPTTWQGAVLRTADGLRAGAKMTASMMATASRAELQKCEASHGKGSAPCKLVAAKIVARLRVWQDKVRPAVRSLMAAMVQLYKDVPARPRPRLRAAPRPRLAPAGGAP